MQTYLNRSRTILVAACTAALWAWATPARAQTSSWHGPFVGVVAGSASTTAAATTSTVYSPTGYFATTSVPAVNTAGQQTLDQTKFIYGVDGGVNGQIGPIIIGAEADVHAFKLNSSQSTTATYPCCAPTTFTVTQSQTASWIFTLRGRAGFAAGPVLAYGTMGEAWVNLDYESLFTDTFATANESGSLNQTQHTLVYGGGVEVRGGRHWAIRGEYLRADFGTLSTTSANFTAYTPVTPFPTTVFTHSTTFAVDEFRAGVQFGF